MAMTPSDVTVPGNRRARNRPLLAVLLAIIASTAGCDQEQEAAAPIVRPVRAVQVAEAGALAERWFPGRAKATREANIAFEVSGRLVERPVDVGNRVKRDDLLARLDPRDFQNALQQALAAVKRSEAFRSRVAKAAAGGAVSQQELTDAEALLEIAKAEVLIRRKALEDSVLKAPFEGTISAILVENYENIAAKQVIMRLLDTTSIEMVVNIPETLISNIPYVKDIKIVFDAFSGREIPAEIKEVSNEANQATRTYMVNLIMQQPEDLVILPGMAGRATGRVELPGDAAAAGYEVPLSALGTDDNDKKFVWVIDPSSGIVARRDVEVADLTPRGAKVTGLNTGEWVARSGVNTLVEGQQVTIQMPGGGA